ncbi:helix-turn-helix transcriptional regulator [Psychrobacillus sp. NEAU-3TGS]|uniref:helix-turn-helix transcriptional regulator n=1 Tax=Psychrobacillus sp. NEAU-3TGS TaxID=2995412 RepID=UPI002497CEC6|nr:helix-turn-helix transcriptional regulator [Psychrobacillus sp. NEAU-3TGS]MDI2588154.1 helix-turn-helix transcriptional regulator [Psychrobacillus sp. NEAU-3TGS]
MIPIELNKRQNEILDIVKGNGPITGEQIAERLKLTRSTLRPDLAILTMAGFLDARPRVGYFYSGKKTSQAISDNIAQMVVKDFQSIPVVVEESMTVYDAICHMFLEDVGSLFVVDKQSLLSGVLSRKDFLRTSIGNQDLNKMPVHMIMTRMPNITYCRKEDTLIEVANKLMSRQIDSLPVVKERKDGLEVVGRITKTNITRAFLSLADDHDL